MESKNKDILEDIWFDTFVKHLSEKIEIEPDAVKDNREIKTNMEILCQYQGMFVYLIAISSKLEQNRSIRLSCEKGKPISKHCYDVTSDSYIINGFEYIKLSDIPFNYQIKLKDSNSFVMNIPVPEKLLKRYFSDQQNSLIDDFKSSYKNCSYEYIQVLKAY